MLNIGANTNTPYIYILLFLTLIYRSKANQSILLHFAYLFPPASSLQIPASSPPNFPNNRSIASYVRINRSSERSNDYSERINRSSKRSNDYSERINRSSERSNDYSERINRLSERSNDYSERINRLSERSNDCNERMNGLYERCNRYSFRMKDYANYQLLIE